MLGRFSSAAAQKEMIFITSILSSSPHHQAVALQVDVYSFGIVMWELLTGEEPYAKMHCGEIIGNTLTCVYMLC